MHGFDREHRPVLAAIARAVSSDSASTCPQWDPSRPLAEQSDWPAHAAFMDGLRVDAERAEDTLNELFAAAEVAGDERSFYRARLIWIELMIEQDPTQTMDAGLAKAERGRTRTRAAR